MVQTVGSAASHFDKKKNRRNLEKNAKTFVAKTWCLTKSEFSRAFPSY
jgi:hypothetical protein